MKTEDILKELESISKHSLREGQKAVKRLGLTSVDESDREALRAFNNGYDEGLNVGLSIGYGFVSAALYELKLKIREAE